MFHWSRNPTIINETDNYDIARAVIDWNALETPIHLFLVTSGHADIRVTEGHFSDKPKRLGEAIIEAYLATGHIKQVVITIDTARLEKRSRKENAKQHVLCHEIGHALGLSVEEHINNDIDSCMNDCTGRSRENTRKCFNHPDGVTPNAADQEELMRIYQDFLH